jgi:hypothetical protein
MAIRCYVSSILTFFNGKTNVTREAFTYNEAIDKRVKRKFT